MLQRFLRAIDGYQQRHRWLGFPFAVNKKFGDDQGGYLAALIAFLASDDAELITGQMILCDGGGYLH